MIYLDYNSSAPCYPSVITKVIEVLEEMGNPSSIHRCGQRQSYLLSEARQTIAEFLDISQDQFIFTSGATESNNLILQGVKTDIILISALSHPSAIEAAQQSGKVCHILPVTSQGLINLDVFEGYLEQYREKDSIVSFSYGESETGIIQPLDPLLAMTQGKKVFIHIDASQSLGRISLHLKEWGVDGASFSGHKVGAPQGVGGIYMKNKERLSPQLVGGGQEWGLRSGTLNLSGIVGFSQALIEGEKVSWDSVEALRNFMEEELLRWNSAIFIAGHDQRRLPNTSLIATGSLSSHMQVIRLDLEEICVSAGNACGAKKQLGLSSLRAMNLPESLSSTAIRISLGPQTTKDEMSSFMNAYQRLHQTTSSSLSHG